MKGKRTKTIKQKALDIKNDMAILNEDERIALADLKNNDGFKALKKICQQAVLNKTLELTTITSITPEDAQKKLIELSQLREAETYIFDAVERAIETLPNNKSK